MSEALQQPLDDGGHGCLRRVINGIAGTIFITFGARLALER